MTRALVFLSLGLVACGPPPAPELDAGVTADAGVEVDAGPPRPDDVFADAVSSYVPGPGAGFGQDRFPEVVLGPPRGSGDFMGSLDVLSLGKGGSIVLEFTDLLVVDGAGPDFLVFENGFNGFFEYASVAVSDDGVAWHEFPCAALVDGGSEGCAGLRPVYSNPDNMLRPLDQPDAGGDAFDLAQVGVTRARFVRVTDTGTNRFYAPPGGGFDLDALAVIHAQRVDGGAP